MEFSALIKALERRLVLPLPGKNAQVRMAPYHSANQRFNNELSAKARKGAVLILLYPDENRICFPLIQRPKYEGVHSGQIALPGGKFEPEDKNLVQTALRESWEEIGIERDHVSVIGGLSQLFIPVSDFVVHPVIGYVNEVPSLTPDQIEVEHIIEADLNGLLDPQNSSETDIEINASLNIRAPYFRVNDKIVWGATAMMLAELVEVINEL
ncbi:MAG: CoA pyrophosphatase [Cyclobacteriaceae bacterium]